MNVLIVGGTSSLGSALKTALSGWCNVITAGRSNCDIPLNLVDPVEEISFPSGIDVVLHTAAHFGGNDVEQIMDAENINVLGTLKLCNAAIKANVKHFIFISSIFSSLNDSSPFYSIYSLSKRHSEELVKLVCTNHSLPFTIIRPSQIYGIEPNHLQHQPFIYKIIELAKNGEEISLNGTNDAIRNFIYMDDVTKVISRVIEERLIGSHACMNEQNVSLTQICNAAFSAFKKNGVVTFKPQEKDIPDNIFKKDNTLLEQLGISSCITIEEGIKKVVNLNYTRK